MIKYLQRRSINYYAYLIFCGIILLLIYEYLTISTRYTLLTKKVDSFDEQLKENFKLQNELFEEKNRLENIFNGKEHDAFKYRSEITMRQLEYKRLKNNQTALNEKLKKLETEYQNCCGDVALKKLRDLDICEEQLSRLYKYFNQLGIQSESRQQETINNVHNELRLNSYFGSLKPLQAHQLHFMHMGSTGVKNINTY